MSKLPDGWATTNLLIIAEMVRGVTYTKDVVRDAPSTTTVPVLRANNIQERGFSLSELVYVPANLVSEQQIIRKGDVVVATSSGSISVVGKAAQAQRDMHAGFGAFCGLLRPNHDLDSRYFGYYFSTEAYRSAVASMARGVNINNLKRSHFESLKLPISPRNEQTRIADQLDKLLARIHSCNDRLDAIPALLKRFRQSILSAAISGTLTEDWREQHPDSVDAGYLAIQIHAAHEEAGGHKAGNAAAPTEDVHDLVVGMFPTGWSLLTLRDVVQPSRPITYGILKPGPELEVGIPYIRVADFPGDRLNLNGIRKTSPGIDAEFKRSRLLPGDLLLSIRGTVGRLVVIPDELAGANITQDSARLSVQTLVNRDYVLWYLRSSMAQDRMKGSTKGVAVRGINIGDVRALQIPLPSREEQNEIVRRVEALFKLADRIEARCINVSSQAKRLGPLTLSKAFRGELVQQDPQDEPASVLLERIAATPPAKMPTSRGRPRIKPEHQFPLPELKPADWSSLPDGAWGAPADPDGFATMVGVAAVLRAWGKPVPEREARLAALFCLQPHLFTAVLPAAEAKLWSRLIGDEARPLPAQVLSFQSAINGHWGRAIKGMRARGDLVETGTGNDITWALGAGAASIETAGWPDGRAGFVVAYLRAHGTDSVLPLLEISAQEFANARAA